MTRSEILRGLLGSYSRADDAEFRRVAGELIAEERRKNHRLLASELERELNAERRPGADIPLTLRPVPKSRDERPLVRLSKPTHDLDELVLAVQARDVVGELVQENRQRASLLSHGLRPRQRLLLLGPSGTGKSATAHAVASELSLPVATASLAALTSSYLGDTARNIESVVRFAEQTPCVLLFDEFDVLGQERATVGDHGELRRVAATVLQLLEDMHGESVVVATSNHPDAVDTAVWRRFDELIELGRLNQNQLAELISLKLRAMRSELSPRGWAKKLQGLSPAEVELVCFDAMRRAVLADKGAVDDTAMNDAAARMRERRKLTATPGRSATSD